MLFADSAIARLIVDAKKKYAFCDLTLQRERKERAVAKKAFDAVCKAKTIDFQLKYKSCLADVSKRVSIYESALKTCNRPTPWYKSPVFGFVIGQIVAGGVCVVVSRAR